MKRKSIEESEPQQNPITIAPSFNSSNHGIRWLRGPVIGKGSFGSVFVASLKPSVSKIGIFPPVMAVKSSEISDSDTLQKEKQIYDNLKGCTSLIKCFGEEITTDDNGRMIYNLLLEFAAGGTLADQIKNTAGGKGLPEEEVRRYTRSIIKGLIHIHKRQYVHCDLKPKNILLVPSNTPKGCRFVAKIADLGLARRVNKANPGHSLRGTLMYMAPETLINGVQEMQNDIWALGCLVLKMLTGNCPWTATDKFEIFKQIIEEYKMPKIPEGVSKEASEFLKSCFVRTPKYRFTAQMLMSMAFVAAEEEDFVIAPTFVEKRQRIPI